MPFQLCMESIGASESVACQSNDPVGHRIHTTNKNDPIGHQIHTTKKNGPLQ